MKKRLPDQQFLQEYREDRQMYRRGVQDMDENCIRCFQEVLHFRMPESNVLAYARTQTNLGNAFSWRFVGDRLDDLDQAI